LPKLKELPPGGFNPAFRDQAQLEGFLRQMNEQQSIFSTMYPGPDPISPMVEEAVKSIEAIADQATKAYPNSAE
jgi:hypothetical protein